MRSIDEMRAIVHAEAARRERRTMIAVGASAVATGVIVLAVLVAVVTFAPPATEVSTGAGPEPAATGSSAVPDPSTTGPGSPARPRDDAATAPESGPAEAPGGATSPLAGPAPATRTPGRAPRTGAGNTGSDGRASTGGAPGAGSAPSAPAGAGGGPAPADRTPPTRSTDPTTPSGPNPPTTADPNDPTTSTTTTTSTTAPETRTCGADDLAVERLTWRSARTGDAYPDLEAPAVEPTAFTLSVWANEGTPCRTADARRELTITDAGGAVVHRRVLDEGPGRLTEPGDWLARHVVVGWDPGCVEPAPDGWSTDVCTPVGAGSYAAQLHVDGIDPPPLALTILGP